MITTDVVIKRGDTLPALNVTLLYASDNSPIDLSGATVALLIRPYGGDAVSRDVEIVDEINGVIRYEWTDEDTETAGSYAMEFQITFFDGRRLSVPNDRTRKLVVVEDIQIEEEE